MLYNPELPQIIDPKFHGYRISLVPTNFAEMKQNVSLSRFLWLLISLVYPPPLILESTKNLGPAITLANFAAGSTRLFESHAKEFLPL